MANFLTYTVLLLSLIVLIGFFNEKVTGLTYEIALMIFSIAIGGIATLIAVLMSGSTVGEILSDIRVFDLERFLMDGVLCFMLFAGSCHIRISDFKKLMRPVGVLAFAGTFLGALIYGFLFYVISLISGLGFTLPMCLMFGSIVAPTDPIAATGILKKFGLPKDISFVIEGESLLNDGVGVALFVCFSGIVANKEGGGFFSVLFQEILGAIVIGTLVSLIFFMIFSRTADSRRKIYISLLSVALSYLLCEHFGCSGAIASVVCGVIYATQIDREEEKHGNMELTEYESFWEILDNLLNSILYVILGFSFVRILQMPNVILLSVAAIICNLIARAGSLFGSTFMIGKIPDDYDRSSFVKLLTWGGLRGGLSIALAMSTSSFLGDDKYYIIIGCTYAVVFFTTVVQGLSMKKVYNLINKGIKKA
ncbi:MAG: sodium:proton antiporter [Lachnospiraceae bacterium]|nr:sodium:proton antiporter [Lachnospiraceae bacterium]